MHFRHLERVCADKADVTRSNSVRNMIPPHVFRPLRFTNLVTCMTFDMLDVSLTVAFVAHRYLDQSQERVVGKLSQPTWFADILENTQAVSKNASLNRFPAGAYSDSIDGKELCGKGMFSKYICPTNKSDSNGILLLQPIC